MAHFDMSVGPKLAETAHLSCGVTDVPFLPKMEQYAETVLLVSNSTPRIHSEASKDQVLSCSCHLLWRASCMHSYVPRPCTSPVFVHLQYAEWPENEAMHAVIAD